MCALVDLLCQSLYLLHRLLIIGDFLGELAAQHDYCTGAVYELLASSGAVDGVGACIALLALLLCGLLKCTTIRS